MGKGCHANDERVGLMCEACVCVCVCVCERERERERERESQVGYVAYCAVSL